jgi:uncharacterized protein
MPSSRWSSLAEQVPIPPFLRRVVGRYVRAFAPERILLFGSYAKGTNHPASDADLLVVAAIADQGAAHLRRARELAADCFPRVDVVFATPEDVAAAEAAPSPFLLSILGTGVVLYERPQSAAAT